MHLKDTRFNNQEEVDLCSWLSSLSDDDWSGGLEGGLEALEGRSLGGPDLRELHGNLGEGSGVISQEVVGLNNAGLDDLD